jgi:hypothetical protein
LITVNGVSKVLTYDTSWDHTINTYFVTTNAAAYAAVGVTLTGSASTIIFTANSGVTLTEAKTTALITDSAAAVVRTGTRLPKQIYAVNIGADAVITSYKYLDLNGNIKVGYKKSLGATLTVGWPVVVFERPVVEIVIASGSVVLDFVK